MVAPNVEACTRAGVSWQVGLKISSSGLTSDTVPPAAAMAEAPIGRFLVVSGRLGRGCAA